MNTFFYLELAKEKLNEKALTRIGNKNKINNEKSRIIIPINSNGNHWIFIFLDLERK